MASPALNTSESPEYSDDEIPNHDIKEEHTHEPHTSQKRRRVTRACDECRRKKIKCDAKHPCTHCTAYSYECTYDQPSNRRRNATPQYIEALESQLKRAKAVLNVVFPTMDLNDPNIDTHLQHGLLPQRLTAGPTTSPRTIEPHMAASPELTMVNDAADPRLEAMVKATGQLDLDEEGHWDYHGHSSGVSFMRGLRNSGDLFQIPADSPASKMYRSMSQTPSSPNSSQSLADSAATMPTAADLPDKIEARMLCDSAILDASAILRVVHLPTFFNHLDSMYNKAPEEYGNVEHSFLPLLFAVLSLGKLFSKKCEKTDETTYETLIDEGIKYFKASRKLMDLTDCRDLTNLQAIIFLIQFLQSSAKLSTCYAYIGVALRSALRMGLHRSFNANFSPIEAETRKRVFWAIRKMDTYVGAMLGLPRFLEDEDIDQEWPAEVDDGYITDTAIIPMPEGSVSVMTAFNAHTRLVQVLSKICKYVYPIKVARSGEAGSVTYFVACSKIQELERDLAQWLDELPIGLKPGTDAPHIIIRVQQMLRMSFGHAQLLLYRPFLHYVSRSSKGDDAGQRAFACASACISVSRNIIHISKEMRKRDIAGAYWFSMYTTFFAVVSILYFVLENPTSPTSFELIRDAVEGKEALAFFAKRSMAADRCSTALNNMFGGMPESIKHGADIVESQKRRHGSSPESDASRPTQLKQDNFAAPRRASTFPESMPNTSRTALPISQTHLASLGLAPTYHSPSPSTPDVFEAMPGLTPSSSTPSLAGYSTSAAGIPRQQPPFPSSPSTGSFSDPLTMNMSDMATIMFPTADPLAYPHQPITTFESGAFPMFDSGRPSQPIPGATQHMPGTETKLYSAGFDPHGLPMDYFVDHINDAHSFDADPMQSMQNVYAQPEHQPHTAAPTRNLTQRNPLYEQLLTHEEWVKTFLDPNIVLNNSRPPFDQQHLGLNDWH